MNKEIEEMADILSFEKISCIVRKRIDGCINCEQKCADYKRAETLYNAGYGKIEDYKKEIERLKEKEVLTHFENLSNDTRYTKDLRIDRRSLKGIRK